MPFKNQSSFRFNKSITMPAPKFKYILVVNVLFVLMLIDFYPHQVYAQIQTDDVKQFYNSTKDWIEKNWPDWLEQIQKNIIPACEKAWHQTEAWFSENMPATFNEFKSEGQSMPQEFLEYLKMSWKWFIDFIS
jgi:hypothetical protein